VTGAPDIKGITEHLRKVLTDGRVDEALGMVESLLAQLRARNTELELQMVKLKKHQFGQRSEKVDPDQLALFLAQAQAESNEIDAAVKAILDAAAPALRRRSPRRSRAGRGGEDLRDLRRREGVHRVRAERGARVRTGDLQGDRVRAGEMRVPQVRRRRQSVQLGTRDNTARGSEVLWSETEQRSRFLQ
jgi:hypothetical protein